MGNTIVKASARKIRRLGDGKILAGFAGSAADGITLFEKFEARLKEYGGNLARAAVELAKDWRTDRVLRRLEALLLVADREKTLLLSGTGDVIEPDVDAAAIGSVGRMRSRRRARCWARRSCRRARSPSGSLAIAGEICIYTNGVLVFEELGA
jgi:ATP-dependent HslUV protease subunit HslV